MREPHSYVDVADAFDDGDPFDVNLRVGFRYEHTYGNIQRESGADVPAGVDPHLGGRNWLDIARHTHTRNILDVGLDVGLFRDFAVFGRMPIILSDDRRLTAIGDPSRLLEADDTVPGDDPARSAPPLFTVPFNSPTRSGLDYIEAGLAWSIMNQNRDRTLPTWVLMVSGRFNLGDPIVACNGTSGTNCRNWNRASDGAWSFSDGGNDAGETRGTNGLRIETRASWRTRYVEPFAGLLFGIEWPANAERFYLPAGNLQGFINTQPPIIGQFTGGLAIIPWEDRENWQRFAIDLRFMGRYVSEGRGYSPLFDALGTSQNRYLTEPNLDTVPNSESRQVPFFGLTDVQPHAELGARLAVEMRAARFVTFQLGLGLWYYSPYIITYTDACNPNQDPDPDPGADGMLGTPDDVRDPRMGTCRSGIINPHHRPAIDLPGSTFRVNEQVRFDLQLSVTGMF